MYVAKEKLLGSLPEYRDEWLLIHPDQTVKDIIKEVLQAHEDFAPYYDKIALYFDCDTTKQICKTLFNFCKDNIRYHEETEEDQTTALPTGILIRGHGDCKHYAGFCGGVLDALNRATGKKIDWKYRFASYDIFDKTPHHVFIVVNDDGKEIWIDPTPGSEIRTPAYQADKKISTMALHRNIAGLQQNAVGITSITVTPRTDGVTNLLFNGAAVEGAILKGMWPVYLGLSDYRDYSGDRNINEWSVAATLNNMILQHGGKHQVDGNFVKWVYDNSLRSWNFYFPGGVEPDFDGKYWIDTYERGMNQTGWPYLIITPDGRLTIDHDVQLDDYRNAGIHILTAWAQSLINKYDPSPYPLRPRALKEFSQNYTGNPGNPNANLFTEARGTSFLQDVGKAIEDGVNFVKDGLLKVVGFIPRNAFLGLVGLNVFHMADDLQDNISRGHWDEISSIWKKLGGNPDKLKSTIDHGAGQPAIEDTTQQTDAVTLGAVQIAAILAAAAPIIAALIKFLNRDGKLNGAITATQAALTAAYPDSDWSFLSGALTQNGTPVDWMTDPQYDENSPYYNPTAGASSTALIVGGVAGLGTLFLMRKKPGATKYVAAIVVGVLGYWIIKRTAQAGQVNYYPYSPMPQQQQPSTTDQLFAAIETGLNVYNQQQQDSSSATIDYNQLSQTSGYDYV